MNDESRFNDPSATVIPASDDALQQLSTMEVRGSVAVNEIVLDGRAIDLLATAAKEAEALQAKYEAAVEENRGLLKALQEMKAERDAARAAALKDAYAAVEALPFNTFFVADALDVIRGLS